MVEIKTPSVFVHREAASQTIQASTVCKDRTWRSGTALVVALVVISYNQSQLAILLLGILVRNSLRFQDDKKRVLLSK